MRSLAAELERRVHGAVLESAAVPEALTTNFGGIVRARPAAVLEPARVEDVVAAVKLARAEGVPLATRGSAHSQSFLAVTDGGILLSMCSMGRVLSVDDVRGTVDVEGGALWRDVVRRLAAAGLIPRVLTNNLDVTVGGTLSMAGVGVASFKYGTQGDQVEELDVVTGEGEIVTCGPDREADLFWAAIAGLGQVGIIVRARLRLRRPRPMTRTYYLLYDDVRRFMDDARRAMDAGAWDHLESWASPCPQGTKPVSGRRQPFARWFFPFHLTVEFDPNSPPDDAALLDGLDPFEHLYTDDLPILDFAERLDPVFELWKRGGTWTHRHPWMEVVLPWATAPDLLDAILPDLPPSVLVGGHILLWPAKGSSSRSRLFMRPPGEDLMGFGILPAVPGPFWDSLRPLLDTASRLSIAMGGKRYLSGWVEFTPQEWREHYGPCWESFAAAKRRYDPDGILNRGFVPLGGEGR